MSFPATMPNSAITRKSFLVRYRTRISTVLLVLLVPCLLFMHPHQHTHVYLLSALHTLGYLLVMCGVLGRLWSILYIGGRKEQTLLRTGPYSLVRHPLYVGSLLLGLGLAALTANVLVLVLVLAYFAVQYTTTIRHEERVLAELFGEEYAAYKAEVPCFLPRVTGFDPTMPAGIEIFALMDEVRHCAVFVLMIPLLEWIELLHTQQVLPSVQLPW